MNLIPFLRKHVETCWGGAVPGFTKARSHCFAEMRGRAPRAYAGPIAHHMLILVRAGAAVFRRIGETLVAQRGDALLVEAGWGSLELLPEFKEGNIFVEVISFEGRSLANLLRRADLIEGIACRIPNFPKSGMKLEGLAHRVDQIPELVGRELGRATATNVLRYLFNGTHARAISLAQSVFYRVRWDLMHLLERYVLVENFENKIAQEYPGGTKALQRDCVIYLGDRPIRWIMRRRMELAELWLRNGNSPDAVAQALGFRDLWSFQCRYAGWAKRSIEDFQKDIQEFPPLRSLDFRSFIEAIRPRYWPAPLPLSEQVRRLFDDAGRIESRSNHFEFPHGNDALASAESPACPLDAFGELDPNFLEMKSTGAEILIPIFASPTSIGYANSGGGESVAA